jgi:hypothetical protein
MTKLKFDDGSALEKASSCCCCGGGDKASSPEPQVTCCHDAVKDKPVWVTGYVMTSFGAVPVVSTELTGSDKWGNFKCRVCSFRDDYTVMPGLYAAGNPDHNSDVFVSANYKFSFDMLRKELGGMNAWILVLDTRGINVWCAAGKGTFGTDELNRRISMVRLKDVVSHKRIIVPQLGAPGVSAYKVKAATGFDVLFGPVLAKDIPAYISAGYKAARDMRTVTFGTWDRLVLTPIELHHIRGKFVLFALITLLYFGLEPTGILFGEAFKGALPYIFLGILSVFAGAVLTPLLLPMIPFRSFALKGWLAGIILLVISRTAFSVPDPGNISLLLFSLLFFPLVSSYLALQFTGATTFTGVTGVKRELKIAAPVYLGGAALSLVALIVHKLYEWGII